MGKSGTGKDTIYNELIKQSDLDVGQLMMYTTREARDGEQYGKEYNFATEYEYEEYKANNLILEERSYMMHDNKLVRYFFLKEKLTRNQLTKGVTVDSYFALKEFYKDFNVIPIFIEVPDKQLLLRSIMRLGDRDNDGCAEVCRRFLKDKDEQWSAEQIASLDLWSENIFMNFDLEYTVSSIHGYIIRKNAFSI